MPKLIKIERGLTALLEK